MNEEGGYLGAMTYQAIYSSAFEKLRTSHSENPEALSALNLLQRNLLQADNSSSSFLFDFAKTLLTDSKLNVNLQVKKIYVIPIIIDIIYRNHICVCMQLHQLMI
jgi:hypothetical protein